MVINGAECSMCIVGAAEGAGWWQHIIRIVIVRRVWLVLSRVWIVWLVWGRVWIVWLVWGRVWVVRGRVPLRVFWSFAASHFTSLQRINLYRIYIHQEWAAAVWAAHYFTSVKMQQCCIEGDMQESHVFWCVPTPSPPPLLGTLDKSLKSWTARVAHSSQALCARQNQSTTKYWFRFGLLFTRLDEDFTIWVWSAQLLLWSDPFNGVGIVGIATRKWRKLQIFAALHHYVVLQIWLW